MERGEEVGGGRIAFLRRGVEAGQPLADIGRLPLAQQQRAGGRKR
jgi:hypothetical protein